MLTNKDSNIYDISHILQPIIIVLAEGLYVLLDPYPQGRLGHSCYEGNDDTYPTRIMVLGFSIADETL